MNLFGLKRGTTKPEDRNLNQLIFDFAEYQRVDDMKMIYRRLSELELFAPALSANFILNGERTVIEAGMELKVPTVQIQGLLFAAFFVNKTDPRLGDRFISMNIVEAFGMIEKTNHLTGVAFYNDKESFFGIGRDDFPMLRKDYLR
ncbi:MAG TPA: hypothetical protein VF627_01830 [Abditibacterium sp.]